MRTMPSNLEQDAGANPAIALRLQFTRLAGRVAELGSFDAVAMTDEAKLRNE